MKNFKQSTISSTTINAFKTSLEHSRSINNSKFRIQNSKFLLTYFSLLIIFLSCMPKASLNNPSDGSSGLMTQLLSNIQDTISVGTVQKAVLTGVPSAISEGQSASVQIKMAKAITTPLTVTITSDNVAITIDGGQSKSITFSPENATTNQTFSISAITDSNTISETVNIKISANGLEDQNLTITALETEAQKVVFTGLPSTITEGQSASVQVKMAKAITSPVTVTITLSDPAITIDGSSSKTISFTTDNSTTNQTFTLAAVNDTNTISETVNVKVSATGLEDQNITISAIDSTISGDVQKVVMTGAPSTITEGQSASIKIKLSKALDSDLKVTISSSDPAILIDGLSTKEITFTPANATQDQTFSLSAVTDSNQVSETSTITIKGTGLTDSSFSVSTVDTTQTTTFVLTNAPSSINEGQTAAVSIKLSQEISSNLTVTISSNQSAITVNGNPSVQLTFAPGSATTNQTFNLMAITDANTTTETGTITITATGIPDNSFSVSTQDTTVINTISVSNAPTSVLEGTSATINVKINNAITSNAVVSIVSDTASFTVSPATRTFTPGNSIIDQSFTLTADQDENLVSESVTITLSSPGMANTSFTLTKTEDDVQSIIANGVTNIDEGYTGQIDVSLAKIPTSDVSVTISSNNPAVTVSPASLTFTPGNYNTTQPITLTSVVDTNQISENVTICLASIGVLTATKSVTVNDNVQISVSGQNYGLELTSTVLNVSLTQKPPANLTVNIGTSNNAYALPGTGSLTFTPANYNVSQPLTIGFPNTVAITDTNVIISFSATNVATNNFSFLVYDKSPVYVDISAGQAGGTGFTPDMVTDSNKMYIVTRNANANSMIYLFICNIDGTNCNYSNISGTLGLGSGGVNMFNPKIKIDTINSKLVIIAEDSSYGALRIIRCDMNGTNCSSFTKPALNHPDFKIVGSTMIIVGDGMTLAFCSLDGVTCSSTGYATGAYIYTPSLAITNDNQYLIASSQYICDYSSCPANTAIIQCSTTSCSLLSTITGSRPSVFYDTVNSVLTVSTYANPNSFVYSDNYPIVNPANYSGSISVAPTDFSNVIRDTVLSKWFILSVFPGNMGLNLLRCNNQDFTTCVNKDLTAIPLGGTGINANSNPSFMATSIAIDQTNKKVLAVFTDSNGKLALIKTTTLY